MSKLTGTIAFSGGVLLILLAITGVLIKNELRIDHDTTVPTEEHVESAGHDESKVPQWLSTAMYCTLVVSGAFTIIQIARHGLSHEPSKMSTAAFIGGNVLVTLGFLATLAVNEQSFRDQDKIEARSVEIVEAAVDHEGHGHESPIPDDLRYLMMGTLFIAGGVTVVHVSKYGLA